MRQPIAPLAITLALAAALAGCTSESVVVYRPRLEWQGVKTGGSARYEVQDLRAVARGEVVRARPQSTVEGNQLTLGGTISARRQVEAVARAHGLESVPPTPADQAAGFSEVYRKDPESLRVREDKLGRSLEIAVTQKTGSQLKEDLQIALGLRPPRETPEKR
jgi:hypothetical protein